MLLELARTIADETGLERPDDLFGDSNEGDITDRRIVRAIEWICRHLTRDWNWPGIPFGQVGTNRDGEAIKRFASNEDVPWPDEELIIQAAVWKIRMADGLADQADYQLLDATIVDLIWRAEEDELYSTVDSGMPGWCPAPAVQEEVVEEVPDLKGVLVWSTEPLVWCHSQIKWGGAV